MTLPCEDNGPHWPHHQENEVGHIRRERLVPVGLEVRGCSALDRRQDRGSDNGRFMVEDPDAKIAGLHDSDAFGTGGFVETAKALKELYGIDVLTEQKYSTGTKDYTAQLLAIKNSGATCVFAWGTRLEDDAIILRQKAQLGLEVDFVGSASYSSTPIRDIAGDR